MFRSKQRRPKAKDTHPNRPALQAQVPSTHGYPTQTSPSPSPSPSSSAKCIFHNAADAVLLKTMILISPSSRVQNKKINVNTAGLCPSPLKLPRRRSPLISCWLLLSISFVCTESGKIHYTSFLSLEQKDVSAPSAGTKRNVRKLSKSVGIVDGWAGV